jgi:uncharacterized repeat protein (TIGR01451 family)
MKTINIIKGISVLILLALNFGAYSQYDLYGIWSKRAAFGNGGDASITTSTMDEDGNVYVAGSFTGTLNFSDDLCNPVMRTAPYSTPSNFIIKYSRDGRYLWDVVFHPGGANTISHIVSSLYYSGGKILYAAVLRYPTSANLPLKVNAEGVGTGNSKTITSPSKVDGSASSQYGQIYFQVVEASTGRLQASISELPSGTFNVASARIEGDNVVAAHFGWASIHGSNSKIASFHLENNGDDYTVDNIAIAYPDQPKKTVPGDGFASRVVQNITLPNGEQVFIHYAHDYTDNTSATGNGIPSYYVLNYTNNYSTKNGEITITDRATNIQPKAAYDAGSNVYVMTNFGHSKYWDTQNDIANSNFILDYMGSGQDFYTAAQHNKIALARISHDLTFTGGAWAIQIGTSGTGGSDIVYGRDIVVAGEHVYITGQFSGDNVPFGSGKTLSSESGSFDGFYAVYSAVTGACEYAVSTGGTKDENNTTMSIIPSSNGVLVGGTYNSPVFQSDPSGRLYPLTNSGDTQQGFLTLYSTNPTSQPAPYPSSFGDAPSSYGTAVHHAYPCLRIGGIDPDKLQDFPQYSADAATAFNDDGIIIAYSGDYTDLSSADFNLNASTGELTAKVTVYNSTADNATIAGWIDFNRNGVFDGASEASMGMKVPANTLTLTTVNLRWTGANAKLQNGVTYMRLRITTDNMDNTQPQGLMFNGEVEDYLLNFNVLEITKTAVSNNRYDATRAMIGDTILYTIAVTNKVQSDVTVFDPIPLGTEYVPGSAVPSSGTLTGVNLYGVSNIPAIKWDLGNKTANTLSTLSFKARLTSYPAGVDSVFNIAYAVMNGDTLPSTGNACDMVIIAVDGPRANNDTVSAMRNTPLTVDVLANDDYPFFCTPELTVIEDSYNGIGAAAVVSGKILYTPAAGKSGIDSIMYQLKCSDDRISAAKVYIMVSDPLSLQYVACPGATVTMGFNAIDGVTYRWYEQPADGSVISTGNTYMATKSSASVQTWWVEPQYGSFVFPRCQVDLELSENCGTLTPVGCTASGSIIWKDDFGGNGNTYPQRAPDPGWEAAGKTTYNYVTRTTYLLPGVNEYALLKSIAGYTNHYWSHSYLDDHTSWGDQNSGYFLNFDASLVAGEFYNFEVDGICAGDRLSFSAWLMNINPSGYSGALPNVQFVIEDMAGNVLSRFYTGNVAKTSKPDPDPVWVNYSCQFSVSDGIDRVKVRFMNNVSAGNLGNDISIDDIEVRLCAPPVTVNITDTTVCYGNSLDMLWSYTEDCTFGNDLAYRLEFRHADSISWKTLDSGTETVDCSTFPTVNKAVSITSADKSDEGYYRLLVSSPANIDSPNCRSASDSVYVHIVDRFTAPDIRLQICPSPPAHTVQLTGYLDSTDYDRVKWEQVSPYPLISNAETGLIANSNFHKSSTYTYKYTLESPEYSGCGSTSARVYIRVLNDHIYGKTVDTVKICAALDASRSINLNQIFGLELGGVLTYPDDPDNVIADNIRTSSSPSKYAGATVFKAQKAYAEADSSYGITYRGEAATKFEFLYTATSCVSETKRVVLIVTEN